MVDFYCSSVKMLFSSCFHSLFFYHDRSSKGQTVSFTLSGIFHTSQKDLCKHFHTNLSNVQLLEMMQVRQNHLSCGFRSSFSGNELFTYLNFFFFLNTPFNRSRDLESGLALALARFHPSKRKVFPS